MTHGHSGARVLRRRGVYRKWSVDADVEVATMSWLRAAGIPTPEVLALGDGWFDTREVHGRSAAHEWPASRRAHVVDALADLSNALHALPVAACPFDRSLAVSVAAARRTATAYATRLDRPDPDAPQQRHRELLAALEERLPAIHEVAVVTHGDFCLPNVILDDDATVVAVVDTGRAGLADRYTDLALMDRSLRSAELNPQYGGEYAQRYLRRCAHDAAGEEGARKLEFYRLLDEFA